jgi:hypothetical protein
MSFGSNVSVLNHHSWVLKSGGQGFAFFFSKYDLGFRIINTDG